MVAPLQEDRRRGAGEDGEAGTRLVPAETDTVAREARQLRGEGAGRRPAHREAEVVDGRARDGERERGGRERLHGGERLGDVRAGRDVEVGHGGRGPCYRFVLLVFQGAVDA